MALPFNAGRPLLRARFVFYTWGVRDLPTSELRSYTAFQRAEPQAAIPLRVCLTANRSRCERPKRIA
jgi:hypothetical protein